MGTTTLRDVTKMLNDVYCEGNIPQPEIVKFAEELLDIIRDDNLCLNDVFIMGYEFESKMQAMGFRFESNNDWVVFHSVLELLERNEQNAKRLVDSYLDYQAPDTFETIMGGFSKFLTQKDRLNIMNIAIETLDEQLWKDYV